MAHIHVPPEHTNN